jgi:hypothetical protein
MGKGLDNGSDMGLEGWFRMEKRLTFAVEIKY